MKSNVLIKCKLKDYDYIIKKMLQNNITIINSYSKNNEYYFVLNEEDYKILCNLDYKKVIIFISYCGLHNLISIIKSKSILFIVTSVISILIFLSNLLILKVNVHTNDVNLNRIITYFLMDNGIKDISLKKNYNNINKIKKKLLDKYNDDIEWLEITKNGYSYDVYIIERKKNRIKNSLDKCNYVAKKSGTITKIKASKGVLEVQENNYVNQGDILISGTIIYNDEIKKEVCASGKIYGEVWYEVDINYPLAKKLKKENKNKFYNITLKILSKRYHLFKNKYKESKIVKNIGNDNIGFDITSSSKTSNISSRLSEEEAIKLALEKANKNIMIKSHNKSKILSQNILKKYVKNDTIYMKVLITAEEELGVVESY